MPTFVTHMLELIGLHYSPWSEKARWALQHHHVPYKYREHLILFGMPELWVKTGRLGDLTVPILVGDGVKLFDSFDIAQYAEAHGDGAKLFPASEKEAIARYNALSEKALDASRALLLPKIAASPAAAIEHLPSFIPGPLRKMSAPLVKVGLGYIARGFKARAKTNDEHAAALKKCLEEFRAELKKAGGKYLLGTFSYADIAMATALQYVSAVSDEHLKLRPATRQCWTDHALKKEFADLVEWRDRIYKEHRRS